MPTQSDSSNSANMLDISINSKNPSSETPYHFSLQSPSQSPPTRELSSVRGGDNVLSRPPTTYPVNEDMLNSEPGVLLAGLQLNLTRQLVLLKSIPWDLSVLSISSPTVPHTSSRGSTKDKAFNPLASIFSSTAQFLDILRLLGVLFCDAAVSSRPDGLTTREHSDQTLSPYGGSNEPDNLFRPERPSEPRSRLRQTTTPSSVTTPSLREALGPTVASAKSTRPPQVLDNVHLLSTICCYSLVVSIFDTIFSQILSKLSEDQPEESNVLSLSSLSSSSPPPLQLPQLVPELLFSSHSVPMNTQLRTQLLVQVVEHQLELLERALGLPAAYCVSKARREDHGKGSLDGGILDRCDARALLQALMDPPTWGDDGGGADNRSGTSMSRAVTSLRSNLKRV